MNSKTRLSPQWISSYRDISGDGLADRLSKRGNRLDQTEQLLRLRWVKGVCVSSGVTCHVHFWKNDWGLLRATAVNEVKTILRSRFYQLRKSRLKVETDKDDLQCLGRSQQVGTFDLRTVRCRLLSGLYRLNLSHTNEYPPGTSPLQVKPVTHQRAPLWHLSSTG